MKRIKQPFKCICVSCGKEFEVSYEDYVKRHAYRLPKCCCKACNVYAHKQNRDKAYKGCVDINRPLTPDTAEIVKMWHENGDSPELIAEVLCRNIETINAIIAGDLN